MLNKEVLNFLCFEIWFLLNRNAQEPKMLVITFILPYGPLFFVVYLY